MALIIKRSTPATTPTPAHTAPVQLTAPKPLPKPIPKPLPKPITDQEQIARNKSDLIKRMEAQAPVVEAVLPKPKVVLKFGGAKKVEETEEPMTPRQQQKLVDSGLIDPEAIKWSPCPIGTRVTITNSMFPWVKHWKPGDKGVVRQISQINSFNGDKTGRYLSHIIDIDMPLEASRKGGSAMLFRWEFEPSAVAP